MDYIDRLIPVPTEQPVYGQSIIHHAAVRQALMMAKLREFNAALAATYIVPIGLIDIRGRELISE